MDSIIENEDSFYTAVPYGYVPGVTAVRPPDKFYMAHPSAEGAQHIYNKGKDKERGHNSKSNKDSTTRQEPTHVAADAKVSVEIPPKTKNYKFQFLGQKFRFLDPHLEHPTGGVTIDRHASKNRAIAVIESKDAEYRVVQRHKRHVDLLVAELSKMEQILGDTSLLPSQVLHAVTARKREKEDMHEKRRKNWRKKQQQQQHQKRGPASSSNASSSNANGNDGANVGGGTGLGLGLGLSQVLEAPSLLECGSVVGGVRSGGGGVVKPSMLQGMDQDSFHDDPELLLRGGNDNPKYPHSGGNDNPQQQHTHMRFSTKRHWYEGGAVAFINPEAVAFNKNPAAAVLLQGQSSSGGGSARATVVSPVHAVEVQEGGNDNPKYPHSGVNDNPQRMPVRKTHISTASERHHSALRRSRDRHSIRFDHDGDGEDGSSEYVTSSEEEEDEDDDVGEEGGVVSISAALLAGGSDYDDDDDDDNDDNGGDGKDKHGSSSSSSRPQSEDSVNNARSRAAAAQLLSVVPQLDTEALQDLRVGLRNVHMYVFCSLFSLISLFSVRDVSVSISLSYPHIASCLHSLTPHT
jgi:hypothetical protein